MANANNDFWKGLPTDKHRTKLATGLAPDGHIEQSITGRNVDNFLHSNSIPALLNNRQNNGFIGGDYCLDSVKAINGWFKKKGLPYKIYYSSPDIMEGEYVSYMLVSKDANGVPQPVQLPDFISKTIYGSVYYSLIPGLLVECVCQAHGIQYPIMEDYLFRLGGTESRNRKY